MLFEEYGPAIVRTGSGLTAKFYAATVHDGTIRVIVNREPVYQPDELVLHISLSHSTGRKVADAEIAEAGKTFFAGIPFEEDNPNGPGPVRHLWELDTNAEGATP